MNFVPAPAALPNVVRRQAVMQEYEPYQGTSLLSNSTLAQNSLYFVPFDVENAMSAGRLNVYLSIGTAFSATNLTGTGGYTVSAELYSRLPGSQSQQISQIWSSSGGLAFSNSSNSNLSITQYAAPGSSFTTTFATSNASMFFANSIAGFREMALGVGSTLAPGRYWMAFAVSTASVDASRAATVNVMQQTFSNHLPFVPYGVSSSASNASGNGIHEGLGAYSVTANAFPASVALTGGAIVNTPLQVVPYFNFSAAPYGTVAL